MKKFFAFLAFMMGSCALYAQTFDTIDLEDSQCKTAIDPNYSSSSYASFYSGSTDPAYLETFDPVVFNLYFWTINRTDGSTHNVMTEDDFLWAVARLNLTFNPFNIFFKYRGFNNADFNSDEYYEGRDIGEIYNYALAHGFVAPNSYNVYLPKTFDYGGGQAPTNYATHLGVRNGPPFYTNGSGTLIHEVAHTFYLFHSFRNHNNSNCEHVTRNPADPNFNAITAGDCVVDTAAMPQFQNGDLDLSTCQYIANDTDCQGTPYSITEADMSYMIYFGAGLPCAHKFTVGQAIRMRETIHFDVSGVYGQATTNVASLYEPYKGSYYIGGPVDPNAIPPLFQPGFQYEFVECACSCPEPSDYNDISFSYTNNVVLGIDKEETDYSLIAHPNHTAIRIVHDDPVFVPQPRKCYNNYNLSAAGGNVIKFEDNIFNNNITVTPVDSTAINSETLIDELPEGLYKIEKTYNDGSTQETVIYKENE